MHDRTTVTLLGIVAAITSTVAFAPQIRKTWTTGGKDLSYSMLWLYVSGVSLWFCYGLAIRAVALALANAVSIVLVGTCLVLKLMKEDRRAGRAMDTRLRIAIDMDETIADSVKEHIRRYNLQFGEDLLAEDLVGKHLEDFVPVGRYGAVRQILRDEGFFDSLEVISPGRTIAYDFAGGDMATFLPPA
jgi:MtN3 and saliva related transmembrane protein